MNLTDQYQEPGKKFSGIALTVAFHIFLVYALLHGAGYRVLEVMHSPVLVKLVEEVKKPPEEPPKLLPQPELAAPPKVVVQLPYIPPPEVVVAPQPQQPVITSTQVKPIDNSLPPTVVAKSVVEAEPVKAAKPAGPVVVPASVNFDTPGCRPAWPQASIRNDESGSVGLSVLIGADGGVVDAKVEKSSGFRNLDNAVKAQLLSGNCRNKPGTVDGKPQQLWIKVIYDWKLTAQ